MPPDPTLRERLADTRTRVWNDPLSAEDRANIEDRCKDAIAALDAQAARIKRLEEALAESDHVVHALELGGEPWTLELMEARDRAVFRHRAAPGQAEGA